MRCACIDIGSNTTRLLVAEAAGGALAPLLERRAFTRLGGACGATGALPVEVGAALADVVAAQVREARALGVGPAALRVVATAGLRRAANGSEVCAALARAAGAPVELLSAEEEARLAFAGATAALAVGDGATGPAVLAPVAVLDAGGGSAQLAAGTLAAGASWSCSLPLGSGELAARHLRGDPPAPAELAALREEVADVLDALAPPLGRTSAGLAMPAVARVLAVGGSATSLRRLAGSRLDSAVLSAALAAIVAAPAGAVARRTGIDARRVRVLPAGIVVLDAFATRIGALEIACGGLREGVVRALAAV